MKGYSTMQELVFQFHKMAGHPTPDKFQLPEDKDIQRHLGMILEEAQELCRALGYEADQSLDTGDLFPYPGAGVVGAAPDKVVKELCDLLYVTLSLAVSMGLPVTRFFVEVHLSNMSKQGGEKRADGKLLKPPHYKEPDIAGLLKELRDGNR